MAVTTEELSEKLYIFLKSRSKFGGVSISIDEIVKNTTFHALGAISLLKTLIDSGRIKKVGGDKTFPQKEKITYMIL